MNASGSFFHASVCRYPPSSVLTSDDILMIQADNDNVDAVGYLAQRAISLSVSAPSTLEVNPLVFNLPADGTHYAVGVCCGTENNLICCNGQPALRSGELTGTETDKDGDGSTVDVDCVDPEIAPFLIVEYVSTPGEQMVCEPLDAAARSYGTAHMVLEAIAVQ